VRADRLERLGFRASQFVGGGIRRPEDTVAALKAGADIIVTGTIAEESFERCREIIQAVKSFKT